MIIRHRHVGYGMDSTLGIYTHRDEHLCFVLEDEGRNRKVFGQTRIPAGRYRLTLRTNVAPPGQKKTFHQRYLDRFGDRHKGMIEITGVPTHTAVLIHIGNKETETAGCQLPGTTPIMEIKNGWPEYRVGNSTGAYWKVYELVVPTLLAGGDVWLEVEDWTGIVDA